MSERIFFVLIFRLVAGALLVGCTSSGASDGGATAAACSWPVTGGCLTDYSVPTCGDAWRIQCDYMTGVFGTAGCPEYHDGGPPTCPDGTEPVCRELRGPCWTTHVGCGPGFGDCF